MIQLYIDPGTGSMLFTILIGVIGAAVYSVRTLFLKLRYKVIGKKAEIPHTEIPFVIFSDDKRYWNVFAPICREMQKRGKQIVYYTGSQDDPVFECGLDNVKAEFIGKENTSFAKLNFLQATIVLSTTPGLDVFQWKRSKQVKCYVHIPHASSDITLYHMFGIDYYDAILLSGEYQVKQIRELENLRGLPTKELYKVGIPYMDEMAKRLEKSGPVLEHSRTVLLAPSWGKSAIFSTYGEKIFEVLLQTGYKIIVRPHPQSFQSEKELINKLMKKFPESEQLEWNSDTDNFEVLRRSDILISDFSGVIFDFSLIYDKPVIYTNPDFDVSAYDAWWLKKPLWIADSLPRLGMQLTKENISNLKNIIDTCITSSTYEAGRQVAKKETWEHFGNGAERTVDWLLKKYEKLTDTKEEI